MTKTIICTGSPGSGVESLYSLLLATGVSEALPASQQGLTPETWHDQLLHDFGPGTTRLSNPIVPNDTQKALANEMLIANSRQACWCWSSPLSTWLLDFWKDLSADVFFILAYADPETEYAFHLRSQADDAQSSDDGLDSWVDYNQQLLRFYNRNRERSILVNTRTCMLNPEHFLHICSERFALDPGLKNGVEILGVEGSNPLETVLATLDVQQRDDIQPLQLELEATASITGERYIEKVLAVAREEYLRLINLNLQLSVRDKELEQGLKSATEKYRKLEPLKEELEKTKDILRELQVDKESLQQELDKTQLANEQSSTRLTDFERQGSELQAENELLILQLHQVQEELEHYFNLQREQQTDAQTSESTARDGRYSVNMDDDIQGTNWYPCEENETGTFRWTGPGESASIRFPVQHIQDALLVVEYRNTLVPAQLDDLSIEVNGKKLPHKVFRDIKPGFIVASLPGDMDDAQQSIEICLVLPRTVSPNSIDEQSADTRALGICINSISWLPLQPVLSSPMHDSTLEKFSWAKTRRAHKLPATGFPLGYFDGLAYLAANPEVKEEVVSHGLPSAMHHYLSKGMKQGLALPLAVSVLPNMGNMIDITRAEQ